MVNAMPPSALSSSFRQDHPYLQCISTEDSLSTNAPHIETLHNHALHSILGVKEGDHAFLFRQVQGAEDAGRVTSYERHDRAARVVHRLRFVHDVPLHASNVDVPGQCHRVLGDRRGQGPALQWGDRPGVSTRHVFRLMRGGRARWKMENETFKTLKNQGDNCEHHYGHGTHNLSVVLATVMMLAFVVDQPQQLCCALFQAVWAKLGSKRLLWE